MAESIVFQLLLPILKSVVKIPIYHYRPYFRRKGDLNAHYGLWSDIQRNVIILKEYSTPKCITVAAGSVAPVKYECKENSILMENLAVVVVDGKRYMDIKDCYFNKLHIYYVNKGLV